MIEQAARAMSADYYRRRTHILRARVLVMGLLLLCMGFLLLVCIGEGWTVRFMLSQSLSFMQTGLYALAIMMVIGVYCCVLARLALYISYHLDHSKIAQALILVPFVAVYLFLFLKLTNIRAILPLATSKLFATFLFFSFWQSQMNEARIQMRLKAAPRIFIVSWHAFFVCRWVLAACWLLLTLGFALAVVSTHPVVDMEGWEGVALLGTFFLVFRAFVRNPNAHADY
jgi:hypothetical protein